MSLGSSADPQIVSRVGKSVTLASVAMPRLRTTDSGAESDAPISKRKPPRSFSLTPDGQRKGTVESRRSKEAPEVTHSDVEGSGSISPRRDSSSKRLSVTDNRKVQNSKRRSAPNPKHRLKFDKGSPVVKAGSMEDLAAWLIDCAGMILVTRIVVLLSNFPLDHIVEQGHSFLAQQYNSIIFASLHNMHTPQPFSTENFHFKSCFCCFECPLSLHKHRSSARHRSDTPFLLRRQRANAKLFNRIYYVLEARAALQIFRRHVRRETHRAAPFFALFWYQRAILFIENTFKCCSLL
jgi:hypothetical protein